MKRDIIVTTRLPGPDYREFSIFLSGHGRCCGPIFNMTVLPKEYADTIEILRDAGWHLSDSGILNYDHQVKMLRYAGVL